MGHNCVRRFTLANYLNHMNTSIILTSVEALLLLLAYSYKHPSVWSNPRGQLYPHRKQLHFHFLLWLSQTGSVLFVKAKANKRPLLCLYFKLLWQHLFNTCTHTRTHTSAIPVSSWSAPCACVHHSAGPFYCPQGWWERWGRNVLPLASISLEYSLEEAKKSEWNLTSLLDIFRNDLIQ